MILAIGAAIGTFIENDFDSLRAKELVYNSLWYKFVLLLSCLNLIFVIYKTKMYKIKTRFLFHISFIIILFGALITHTFGIDGTITIKENQQSNIIIVADQNIEIPFFIKLNDFKLLRYPGSRSPSEFSSEVTIIDTLNNNKFDSTISMNNTLTYKGYKFFQTSYKDDEKSTILSVNNDPGVEITYLGYALLFVALIFNMFDKKSRFQFLVKKIKDANIASLFLLMMLFLQTPSYASNSKYTQDYLNEHQQNSKELADAFGGLVVQGPTGRMKPLNTQNIEVLNKLTSKDTWNGMSADQVILGMFSRPQLWKKVNIIKLKTEKLRDLIGVSKEQKLVKFIDFFDKNGNYKLSKEVEAAHNLVPSQRGTFERDLIKVDERLNIAFMVYRGVILTIFPLPNDEREKWVDFKTMFAMVDNSEVKRATSRLLDSAFNRNYSKGITYIEVIKNYQNRYGHSIIPSQKKIDIEIWFNNTNLFFILSIIYLLIGLTLLIYGLSSILHNKLISQRVKHTTDYILYLLFIIHSFGIAIRWYIGGYAPISNTYETMIFISYASILASILFLRKSTIALSASFIMASIFIFSAYLGEIDPQITNLVPVLKSYWLSIHVSVITASYSFFGIGAILGIISLILFNFNTKNSQYVNKNIQTITYINEITLLLGLSLLIIGNFLGAIWANESWGRYWGWDPKETWAYISILVYAIVLHIRLIKNIYSVFLFNVLSIIAFSSILMTYFGVNYYLTGMHSYATGDPVPIPMWVYIISGLVLLLIIVSYKNKSKD